MKYFLDTEFIEGFNKPMFGKRRHFIDLISIGVVREDGKSYYAVSTEFNERDANVWVRQNVISKLPLRRVSMYDSPRQKQESLLWKPNKQIVLDILHFFDCTYIDGTWGAPAGIEVYGYYADYDWVLFCSLFGRMIDLPKGFPMYCIDLKQIFDNRNLTWEWKQKHCPDPEDEHNALADAKWNKKLYDAMLNSTPNDNRSVATEDK